MVWSKRSNKCAKAPLAIKASRKSHSVFASGTGSTIVRPQNRIQDRRSRTKCSVCSKLRPCWALRYSILNFSTASNGGRPWNDRCCPTPHLGSTGRVRNRQSPKASPAHRPVQKAHQDEPRHSKILTASAKVTPNKSMEGNYQNRSRSSGFQRRPAAKHGPSSQSGSELTLPTTSRDRNTTWSE